MMESLQGNTAQLSQTLHPEHGWTQLGPDKLQGCSTVASVRPVTPVDEESEHNRSRRGVKWPQRERAAGKDDM